MTGSPTLAARARRAWERVRTRGLSAELRYYVRRMGIRVTPFYYAREALPPDVPTALTAFLPEGFAFEKFGAAEIATIAGFSERGAPYTDRHVRDSFHRGDTCLGVKHQGEIVGFTWFALDATHSMLHPAAMRPNEAYLYNTYVVPEVRGRNLAAILRYKSYQMLQEMGRDTFYSITLTSNQASWRFKQKLDAQRVFLAVHINLFDRFRWSWVLRRY